MKRFRYPYFFFLLVCLFIACDKVSAFELETNEERMDRQSELMKIIDSRTQIAAFSIHSDYFGTSFTSGKVINLSLEGTPVFHIDNNREWKVNSSGTGMKAKYEGEKAIIPDISISETGNWIIEGTETAIVAHTDLTNEDLEMSYISHIVYANDWVHVFLFDGDPIFAPVIADPFYQVPAYFMDSLVKKEKMAESILASAGDECASFVFFTDTHWGKNMKRSPSLIRHIVDYTPIEDVIFGGDVVTSHSTNLVTPIETGKDFQASFSFLGTNFHCVFGNHDDNSTGQSNKPQYHLSEEQVYSFLQSQMTDVTYGNYYNFYYDNPLTKTRIIGLDTGRYYNTNFKDKLPDTVTFAVHALSTVPDGWHVIIASHLWLLSTKKADGSSTFHLDSSIKQILSVFDDYNDRKAGNYTYKKQEVPYDFTLASGKIEFCIGGHIHSNQLTFSEKGIPIITVISDYFKSPEKGTVNEQSVTLVVTDYRNRIVNLFVVGQGTDRTIDLLSDESDKETVQ